MPYTLTNDKSTLVPVMVWCLQATSHYLSQGWPRSMSPYGVTRPQWVNCVKPGSESSNLLTPQSATVVTDGPDPGALGQFNLWINSNEPIRQHRSGKTLAQVMSCCLMVSSHYLNQCRPPFISEVLWHSTDCCNKLLFCITSLNIILSKLPPHLPGAID